MSALIPANLAVDEVIAIVAGLPASIAGSSAAAAKSIDKQLAYDDIDVWFQDPLGLIAGAERLRAKGFVIEDRHTRVYERWLSQGMARKWNTHSLKLSTQRGIDVNLVFKKVDNHPMTSAGQVIESFDFGLLALAYDLKLGDWRDMRSYMFPGLDPNGPLPLLPIRREAWKNGFISEYQGLREVGRYVKYHDYGWDMSAVKPDLVEGYLAASRFYNNKDHALGPIFETLALEIDGNDLAKLRKVSSEILFMDDLDKVMEALD